MPFLMSTLYVAALGVLSHYIGEALPRRWFHWDRFPFREWGWERGGSAYDRIHIRDWKDKMPDMSRVMKDMVPKRFSGFPHTEEVYTLIRETCVAEAVHVGLCCLAPVIYLFWMSKAGVFLSFVVILGNLPFILIQRYNRPMLVALAKRLEEREERRRNASIDPVGEYRERT